MNGPYLDLSQYLTDKLNITKKSFSDDKYALLRISTPENKTSIEIYDEKSNDHQKYFVCQFGE